MDPVANFAIPEFFETALESVPQAILQSLALADLSAATPSTGQYVSIAWSILNIAYTFVSVSISLDQSENFRACHPAWYGFVEKSKETAIGVALGLFDLGYTCSKLLAVAMLGSVSGEALATGEALMAWLAAECAVFLLVRIAVGQWRFFTPAGDSTALSLLISVGWLIVMLAAPFTPARGPHYISPSIYAGFIAWTLFCANPLMLALAYTFEDKPKLEWQTAAMALGASTALCVVGAACTLASMPERFRSTFYKHHTLAMYLEGTCGTRGSLQDRRRASRCTTSSSRYRRDRRHRPSLLADGPGRGLRAPELVRFLALPQNDIWCSFLTGCAGKRKPSGSPNLKASLPKARRHATGAASGFI